MTIFSNSCPFQILQYNMKMKMEIDVDECLLNKFAWKYTKTVLTITGFNKPLHCESN